MIHSPKLKCIILHRLYAQSTSTARETGQSSCGHTSPPYNCGVVGTTQVRLPTHSSCTTAVALSLWQDPTTKPLSQLPVGLPNEAKTTELIFWFPGHCKSSVARSVGQSEGTRAIMEPCDSREHIGAGVLYMQPMEGEQSFQPNNCVGLVKYE